jgi:putative transposase
VGVARWSLYDQPVGASAEDVALLRLRDEPDTVAPFSGSRRMTAWLHSRGSTVHHKRVRRLRRTRGLETIDPKPRLSQPADGPTIDPSLLRGGTGDRVNQVWSAEITSIRWQSGVVSLVAVLDWVSRDVLSWAVSITMDVPFGVDALDQALARGRPEMFNTDHGAQFTSHVCTAQRQTGGVRSSMDGRGRALDHVFVARLWRRVKYEEVYRRDDHTGWDARHGLARYCAFSNAERRHQALGYRTPAAVYCGGGQKPAN